MNNFKIFLAKYLVFVVVLVWVWVWARAKRSAKIQLLVATISAGILALIITKIASKLYYDPRPFVTQHIKPLVAHAADNGFPSEHSVLAATLATIIIPYAKRWAILAGVLAILVGIGRVLVHVHSPVDIIAGFAIGIVSAAIGWWLAGMIRPEKPSPKSTAKSAGQPS